MFVNIVHFPPVKEGKDAEFLEWFSSSNKVFAKHPGFIRRVLLRPRKAGVYVAVVEHESFETFTAMHTSADQAQAQAKALPLLDGHPNPLFYDVVVG